MQLPHAIITVPGVSVSEPANSDIAFLGLPGRSPRSELRNVSVVENLEFAVIRFARTIH